MKLTNILSLPLLIILLLLSAFFSGTETAFFSMNHFEKETLKKTSKGKKHKLILGFLSNPGDILITVLTGNMIVNLFFASIMDQVISGYVEEYGWFWSTVISTVLVLIFGELTPKNLAIRRSMTFFTFVFPLLRLVHFLFTPVRRILKKIESGIITFLAGRIRGDQGNQREIISSTFQIGLQKGLIHPSEMSIL
ncbi:MAG: DUF21 domain-containing protein, partial [Spirochaetota bacterium]